MVPSQDFHSVWASKLLQNSWPHLWPRGLYWVQVQFHWHQSTWHCNRTAELNSKMCSKHYDTITQLAIVTVTLCAKKFTGHSCMSDGYKLASPYSSPLLPSLRRLVWGPDSSSKPPWYPTSTPSPSPSPCKPFSKKSWKGVDIHNQHKTTTISQLQLVHGHYYIAIGTFIPYSYTMHVLIKQSLQMSKQGVFRSSKFW